MVWWLALRGVLFRSSGVTTFWQGGSVTLDAGVGFSSYLWSNGDNTQTITVNTNGTFTVRVTDGNSCQSLASAPVTVTVNPLPVAVITPSGVTTFCQGGSVTLDAGVGFSSYLWSNGDNTQTRSEERRVGEECRYRWSPT